jgi:hypothetical protein
MAISVTIAYDDTWASRMQPMIEDWAERMKDDPVIVSVLSSLDKTMDDLTPKQKYLLRALYTDLRELAMYEGAVAARSARLTIIQDIEENFPLEIGSA